MSATLLGYRRPPRQASSLRVNGSRAESTRESNKLKNEDVHSADVSGGVATPRRHKGIEAEWQQVEGLLDKLFEEFRGSLRERDTVPPVDGIAKALRHSMSTIKHMQRELQRDSATSRVDYAPESSPEAPENLQDDFINTQKELVRQEEAVQSQEMEINMLRAELGRMENRVEDLSAELTMSREEVESSGDALKLTLQERQRDEAQRNFLQAEVDLLSHKLSESQKEERRVSAVAAGLKKQFAEIEAQRGLLAEECRRVKDVCDIQKTVAVNAATQTMGNSFAEEMVLREELHKVRADLKKAEADCRVYKEAMRRSMRQVVDLQAKVALPTCCEEPISPKDADLDGLSDLDGLLAEDETPTSRPHHTESERACEGAAQATSNEGTVPTSNASAQAMLLQLHPAPPAAQVAEEQTVKRYASANLRLDDALLDQPSPETPSAEEQVSSALHQAEEARRAAERTVEGSWRQRAAMRSVSADNEDDAHSTLTMSMPNVFKRPASPVEAERAAGQLYSPHAPITNLSDRSADSGSRGRIKVNESSIDGCSTKRRSSPTAHPVLYGSARIETAQLVATPPVYLANHTSIFCTSSERNVVRTTATAAAAVRSPSPPVDRGSDPARTGAAVRSASPPLARVAQTTIRSGTSLRGSKFASMSALTSSSVQGSVRTTVTSPAGIKTTQSRAGTSVGQLARLGSQSAPFRQVLGRGPY